MDDQPTKPARLTPKQQRFADAYMGEARGNATEAARLCNYAHPMQEGWRLLRNAEIRAYIDERLLAESLSAAEVLHHLTDVAASEWRDHVEIRQDKMGRRLLVKMDLSSKVKALELLGKAHKLFTDKVEATTDGRVDVRVIYDDAGDPPPETP